MAIDPTTVSPILTSGPPNASGTASNVGANGTITATDGKTEFLQLLVTQLKNQDPTNPTDETQMLAQLAQFSQLEQLQNLNSTMSSSASLSSISQASALIGKTVTTTGTTTTPGVSGVVSYVSVQNGKTMMHIGSQDVDASTISQVQ